MQWEEEIIFTVFCPQNSSSWMWLSRTSLTNFEFCCSPEMWRTSPAKFWRQVIKGIQHWKIYFIIKKITSHFYASYTGKLMCTNSSSLPSWVALLDLVVLNNVEKSAFSPCLHVQRWSLSSKVWNRSTPEYNSAQCTSAARGIHKLQGAGIMPEHTLFRKQKCPRGSKRNSLLAASGKVTAQQGNWHRKNECGACRTACPSCSASVLASSLSPKVPRGGRGKHCQALCNLQPWKELHAGAPSPHSTPACRHASTPFSLHKARETSHKIISHLYCASVHFLPVKPFQNRKDLTRDRRTSFQIWVHQIWTDLISNVDFYCFDLFFLPFFFQSGKERTAV